MKKYIGLILALVLMTGLVTSAYAIGEKWRFSDDLSTLTDGDTGYEFYALPNTFFWEPTYVTVCNDAPSEYADSYVKLCYPDVADDVILVYEESSLQVLAMYVSEDRAEEIDDFIDGEYSKIRVRNHDMYGNHVYTEVKSDYFSELSDYDGATKKFDVSKMDANKFYEIVAYDSSDTIGTVCGAIYNSSGTPYFVDYSDLDNSNFTADGSFSFRHGTVTMTKVEDTEYFEDIMYFLNISDDDRSIFIQYDYYSDSEEVDYTGSFFTATAAKVFTGIVISLLGYLLPLIPTIIGFVLPHTKKHGYTKRWYWLSGLGLAWMATVTAILLMLVL